MFDVTENREFVNFILLTAPTFFLKREVTIKMKKNPIS